MRGLSSLAEEEVQHAAAGSGYGGFGPASAGAGAGAAGGSEQGSFSAVSRALSSALSGDGESYRAAAADAAELLPELMARLGFTQTDPSALPAALALPSGRAAVAAAAVAAVLVSRAGVGKEDQDEREQLEDEAQLEEEGEGYALPVALSSC
jgi:hypothetical protein